MTPIEVSPRPHERLNPTPGLVLGVVLLAAGASSRMGRPKLLLPWGATTVLGHLLKGVQELCPSQIAVVLASGETVVARELDRLAGDGLPVDRIMNPDPTRGMFSSIQAAACWKGWHPSISHWLIGLGDQPQVRWETWRLTLAQAIAHPKLICQPARAGRARHPVLLPSHCFLQLAQAKEGNLKQFLMLREAERHCFESDDPGLDLDLDYPADYERLKNELPA